MKEFIIWLVLIIYGLFIIYKMFEGANINENSEN